MPQPVSSQNAILLPIKKLDTTQIQMLTNVPPKELIPPNMSLVVPTRKQ